MQICKPRDDAVALVCHTFGITHLNLHSGTTQLHLVLPHTKCHIFIHVALLRQVSHDSLQQQKVVPLLSVTRL